MTGYDMSYPEKHLSPPTYGTSTSHHHIHSLKPIPSLPTMTSNSPILSNPHFFKSHSTSHALISSSLRSRSPHSPFQSKSIITIPAFHPFANIPHPY